MKLKEKTVEEFRKKFCCRKGTGDGFRSTLRRCDWLAHDVEQFLINALSHQKEDFRRAVEGKRIKYGTTDYSQKILIDRLNQALTDILKAIEEL